MNWIESFLLSLEQLGYFGIVLGLTLEIIPSELVLAYGGYLIGIGKISFIGALIAGIVGGTIAQIIVYLLGRVVGRPFFIRYGRFFLISEKHLCQSEEWFEKHGHFVVFFARFIPVIRHAISIPAGVSKMPIGIFTLYTIGAMIPWTILFLLLGMELGTYWPRIEEVAKPYIFPIILFSVISGSILLWINHRSSK